MNSEHNRIFLAVVLSAFVLFVWQSFFAPQPQVVPAQTKTKVKTETGQPANTIQKGQTGSTAASDPVVNELKNYKLSGADAGLEVNNQLSLINFDSKNTFSGFHEIVGSKSPFEIFINTRNGYQKINFNKIENRGNELVGENTEFKIRFSIREADNGKYSVDLFSETPYKYRVQLNSLEQDLGNARYRQFLLFTNEVNRETIGDDSQYDAKIRWIGIDFNYHLFAVVFKNSLSAFTKTVHSGTEVATVDGESTNVDKGTLVMDLNNSTRELAFNMVFSNKEYDVLRKQGDNLSQAVDFGMFEIISVPILRALQFFYKYVKNYGLAIIILTIIIRLLTFPLQYKSFKSMKRMQVIQPELTKIRDKFKDDPQRMQKESMELFKRSGVNPLSGCLPMLLQMPIFFAFYTVLRESIELVNAPFIGWISDLSAKDPLYILPVLLTIAMFMHQKLTPTPSADPNQKKIMMMMPLIFGVFMLNLPAGLSLYILVSTVFGMLQQLFVYRQAT